MKKKEIVILHDSGGEPYFEAVEFYAKKNGIGISYYETDIIKKFIASLVYKKEIDTKLLRKGWKNFLFLLNMPRLKNAIVVFGIAPYNFRVALYGYLGRKNLLIYHTSYPYWNDDSMAPMQYGALMPIMKKIWKSFLFNRVSKIVTVTRKTKETFVQKWHPDKPVYQIYHSVDIEKFSKALPSKKKRPIALLFVGKLIREKGIEILIELIEKIDSEKYHLTIVGDGPLRKLLKETFRKPNVTYHGWVENRSRLADIYTQHHILLNPSLRTRGWEELFGIVNIEAMAAGLIPIASNHVGPSEIIDDGVDGFLVEEGNVEQIIEKLTRLEQDDDLFKRMQKNARRKVKQFGLESIAEKWEKVFDE